MKRSLFLSLAAIGLFIIITPSAAQKDSYSGVWKLDREKSTIPEYTPVLIKISVQIKGDSLLTERTYDTGDGSEYPFYENLTLDGKEINFEVYNMPRKTKAHISDQDGLLNLESVTTFEDSSGPSDFTSDEIWKVDKENKVFTISFKNKTPQGENEGTLFFTKAE